MLNQDLKQICELVSHSGRVAFVSGKFNILHPGHLRLLRFAKEISDVLVVGVLSQSSASDIYLSNDDRLLAIQSTSWVDYAFIIDTNLIAALKLLSPDVVVKGREHERRNNVELPILEEYGGKLIFGSGDTRFSSRTLINYEVDSAGIPGIERDHSYEVRHNITDGSMCKTISKIKDLKVIVIGETIIDEYIDCQPVGMSAEDPTLVVTPIENRLFLGGAGIVAAHTRHAQANVEFITVLGHDETASYAKKMFAQYGLSYTSFEDQSRPTPRKKRFRADGKTLLRVNELRDHEIGKDIQDRIVERIVDAISETDLLVFADFNYGLLPQELVSLIVSECGRNSVPLVADSQSSSQIGDISRYHNCSLLTPTEREARIATRNYRDGLVVLAEELREKACAENVLITLGSEGAFIHTIDESDRWANDRISALNRLPRDVAGAGDALFVYTSLGLVSGADIWVSAYLGSVAAACQVSRVGNIPLDVDDLSTELTL